MKGVPSQIRWGGTVPHNKGRTYAQKLGLRYEQKVHDVLSSIYNEAFRPAPSILYVDRSGLRRAIPDGILELPHATLVVEIKYSHCELAWWQLNRLYAPLIARLISRPIQVCEIVHSFDPDVVWPGPMISTESLHRVPLNGTGVLTWKL